MESTKKKEVLRAFFCIKFIFLLNKVKNLTISSPIPFIYKIKQNTQKIEKIRKIQRIFKKQRHFLLIAVDNSQVDMLQANFVSKRAVLRWYVHLTRTVSPSQASRQIRTSTAYCKSFDLRDILVFKKL